MPEVVLISDPRVTTIPVKDCSEPLKDLRTTGLHVDERRSDHQGAFARLRTGVFERLVAAEKHLSDGLRFLVIEGYRPLPIQKRAFESYHRRLSALHPDWPAEDLHAAASRYVSPPEVAPHTAGAAVDLTLCTRDGTELDMGTPVNATPEESQGACYTAATNISDTARRNREVLSGLSLLKGSSTIPPSGGTGHMEIATGH